MPTAPSTPLLRLPDSLRKQVYARHKEARDFLSKYNTFPNHCSDKKSSRSTNPPAYSFESPN